MFRAIVTSNTDISIYNSNTLVFVQVGQPSCCEARETFLNFMSINLKFPSVVFVCVAVCVVVLFVLLLFLYVLFSLW